MATCVILAGSLNSLIPTGYSPGRVTDRIWLDRDHGLAVRKREMARDGRVSRRWINTELREVEPGLWLPMHCRGEQFADDAPDGWKEKPVMIDEVRVRKLEVNKVKDELFDMTPRKADRIEDLRGLFGDKK